VSKIIPFSQLQRLQHINYLEHKRREFREREDYLASLRKLIFRIEAQMREAEVLQLDLFSQAADHFQIPTPFPRSLDRLQTQELFFENPFLSLLREFFTNRLTPEECYQKIEDMLGSSDSVTSDQ
jgi:hypothetical protein